MDLCFSLFTLVSKVTFLQLFANLDWDELLVLVKLVFFPTPLILSYPIFMACQQFFPLFQELFAAYWDWDRDTGRRGGCLPTR